MSKIHSLLRMQLSQQGLSEFASPEELVRVWPSLLSVVSRTYLAADSYRQAIERDLASANHEKKLLFDKVLRLEDELIQKQSQLDYYMSHDTLTELLNRHEFAKRIEHVLQHREADEFYAVILIDLDRFKVINDSCGHEGGDQLLREIANLLSYKIQRNDSYLARLGGDEFAILLSAKHEQEVQELAEKLRHIIQEFQFVWDGTNFALGASIGVLPLGKRADNAQVVLDQVDSACYRAKEQGRNRVCLFEDRTLDVARHSQEMLLLNEINAALEANRFKLFAQPIVALKDDKAESVHYEVLLRMFDQNNNMLLPNTFLPVAERYNLMPTLDRWVVSNTYTILARNRKRLDNISFCTINLSGQSVTDEHFHHFLLNSLQGLEIPPEKICFEITETVAIENLTKATEFIHSLKSLGCRFALDDFGSGMSSFAYLKYLPVDFLKIDGVFVKDIIHDQIDYAMVKSINDIGQVMGKETIAEFVENEEIMQLIKALGVDYAQGFGVAKPQEFISLLNVDKE